MPYSEKEKHILEMVSAYRSQFGEVNFTVPDLLNIIDKLNRDACEATDILVSIYREFKRGDFALTRSRAGRINNHLRNVMGSHDFQAFYRSLKGIDE